MRIYSAAVLAEMRTICAAHDVLFIADEVMTGWGRTGTLLACEQVGIVPDILCLSKGLTGGRASARGDGGHSGHLRCPFLQGSIEAILSFVELHREPDRLRGGARKSRDLAR